MLHIPEVTSGLICNELQSSWDPEIRNKFYISRNSMVPGWLSRAAARAQASVFLSPFGNDSPCTESPNLRRECSTEFSTTVWHERHSNTIRARDLTRKCNTPLEAYHPNIWHVSGNGTAIQWEHPIISRPCSHLNSQE